MGCTEGQRAISHYLAVPSQDRGSLFQIRLPSGSTPPPYIEIPTLIGWDFFACSPSETALSLASVHHPGYLV